MRTGDRISNFSLINNKLKITLDEIRPLALATNHDLPRLAQETDSIVLSGLTRRAELGTARCR